MPLPKGAPQSPDRFLRGSSSCPPKGSPEEITTRNRLFLHSGFLGPFSTTSNRPTRPRESAYSCALLPSLLSRSCCFRATSDCCHRRRCRRSRSIDRDSSPSATSLPGAPSSSHHHAEPHASDFHSRASRITQVVQVLLRHCRAKCLRRDRLPRLASRRFRSGPRVRRQGRLRHPQGWRIPHTLRGSLRSTRRLAGRSFGGCCREWQGERGRCRKWGRCQSQDGHVLGGGPQQGHRHRRRLQDTQVPRSQQATPDAGLVWRFLKGLLPRAGTPATTLQGRRIRPLVRQFPGASLQDTLVADPPHLDPRHLLRSLRRERGLRHGVPGGRLLSRGP